MFAAEGDRREIVSLLLDRTPQIHDRNHSGETSLMAAADDRVLLSVARQSLQDEAQSVKETVIPI